MEFLKREEVQTMQKDIVKLREFEAQKERERISSIKAEEIKPAKAPENLPVAEEKEPAAPEKTSVSLMPKLTKKPPLSRKILVRVGFFLIFLLIIGFFYWLWQMRKPETPSEVITPSPQEKATTTVFDANATTTPEEPTTSAPLITERIVNWGYYIPAATRTIDTIIILSSASPGEDPYSVEGVIQESQKYKVSPHYLINREGVIYRLVPDDYVAYHAGSGRMPDGSRKNIINVFSIGIELIYVQTESPNDAQYESLTKLIAYLKQEYNIPGANILGHNEINPSRKTDPWNFDWEKINE